MYDNSLLLEMMVDRIRYDFLVKIQVDANLLLEKCLHFSHITIHLMVARCTEVVVCMGQVKLRPSFSSTDQAD